MTESLDAIGDNNATLYVRYLIAAEQAVLRGEFNNAKVLRALAYSHRTLAMNAFRASGEELPAAETLSQSVLNPDEIEGIRTAFALADEQIAAQQSAIARKAINSLDDHPDVPEWIIAQFIFTCINCGYIVEGHKPEACPVCSALSTEFEGFGPFYAADAEHLGQLTPDSILETLGGTVQQIVELTANVDDATLAAKPSPSEWSAKEIIGHIIETDVLFLRRINSILTGASYTQPVPPWKLHEGKEYDQKLRDELLESLKQARQRSIERVQNLTRKEWATTSFMLGGNRSVLDMGTWVANHDYGHIEQVKRLLNTTEG